MKKTSISGIEIEYSPTTIRKFKKSVSLFSSGSIRDVYLLVDDLDIARSDFNKVGKFVLKMPKDKESGYDKIEDIF